MTRFGHEVATGGAAIIVALLALWASAIAPLRDNVDRLDREVRELKDIVRTRSEEVGSLRERVAVLEDRDKRRVP